MTMVGQPVQIVTLLGAMLAIALLPLEAYRTHGEPKKPPVCDTLVCRPEHITVSKDKYAQLRVFGSFSGRYKKIYKYLATFWGLFV